MTVNVFTRCRRGGLTVVLLMAVGLTFVATGVARRSFSAKPDKGVIKGAIRFVGGAVSRNPRKVAGDVRVFALSGRLVARQHVRADHDYRFSLAPGRYLLTPYKNPNTGPRGNTCPAAKARVRPNRTATADVYVGCGIE